LLDDPRLTLAYGADYVRQLRRPTPAAFRVTPAMIASLGQTVRRVIEGGGVVIAGTDAPIIPSGLSLHTELMSYVEAGGLTPVQALRTATSAFADAMGLGNDLGSIAVGRLADLSMVEGNPLERIADARRVKLVMKNGETFSIEQLMAGPVKRPPATPRR
jgi:imidazolonepropionase-like amidohydrolase